MVMSHKSQIGRNFLTSDKEFALFAQRMNDIGKIFLIAAGKPPAVPHQVLPPEIELPLSSASDAWLDACLRDYLDRKKSFETRFQTKKQFIARLTVYTLIFCAVLWATWPVWNIWGILFPVSNDESLHGHYNILSISPTTDSVDIKKAYREAVKKWHPDRNPQCGEYCKEQMIKIQRAHDVLLARGDQRFALVNIEEKRANDFRSFMLFRIFYIASGSAKQLNSILGLVVGRYVGSGSSILGIGCHAFTLLFFALYEATHFEGNGILLLQLVFHVFTVLKPHAGQYVEETAVKVSHVDLFRETAFSVVPVVALEVLRILLNPAEGVISELGTALYGCLYVMAFLNKFTPNIRDNIVMRKCSIPYVYLSNGRFPRLLNLCFTEVGFLLDDALVYYSGISFIPRVTVFIMHFVFLCQMCCLPWDPPVSFQRKKNIPKEAAASREHNQETPASQTVRKNVDETFSRTYEPLKTGEKGYLSASSSEPPPPTPLSDKEVAFLSDLDKDPVMWMDVPYIRYCAFQPPNPPPGAPAPEQQEVMVLRASTDLQNVAVLYCSKARSGQLSNAKLIKLFPDPAVAQLVAMDGGSEALIQVKGSQLSAPPSDFYEKLLGSARHKMTNSQVWRARVNSRKVVLFSNKKTVLAGALFFIVLVLFALFSPSMIRVLRGTKELPTTLRPLLYERFVPYLPPEHLLNHYSAGLLTVRGAVLLVPDYWDAYRQLKRFALPS